MSEVSKTAVIYGNTLFAIHLLQELGKTSYGNLIFSPLSVHTLLSLIYQGSRGNTLKTLAKVLNIPEVKQRSAEGYKEVMSYLNSVSSVTLHIANKIFFNDSFVINSSFQTLATSNFFSETASVNIRDAKGTSNTINSWVEGKTNKKITNVVKPDMIDSLTDMILINAIYFKGIWADKFMKENTLKEKFYVSTTETIDADMMHQESNFRYGESSELDAKILELPYAKRQLSMYIILPNKVDGIKELEQKLSYDRLNDIFAIPRLKKVKVTLPKFKIESSIDLEDILKQLGLEIIFSDNANFSGLLEADFSGPLKEPVPLKVHKALQKTYIEVNEEGTEAVAVTCGVKKRPIKKTITEIFSADHPFLILLQAGYCDNTILFVGRIMNPV